uniref:cytochrome b n=1 Tax=Parasacculina shiinoi TaxID=2836419 RepID=UPI002551F755|nr:cytochrome b [Parasacculina shiinoi]WGU20879.1 cytochrome b [Parasacculina shiinoi]
MFVIMVLFMMNLMVNLPTPSNINYFWNFGSLLILNFLIQILTGLFLSFHYVSDSLSLAFFSVFNIMFDVHNGWLLRYIHMNGASFFFIFCYMHIGRSLYYGNYMSKLVWFSGVFILLLLFFISFLGYVLPWGQMSLWGATVITKLVSAIPYWGDYLVEWVWGGYSVNSATLTRFFSLHFLFPFLLFFLVFLHIYFLHMDGSSNPLIKVKHLDKVPFYPFFLFKDFLGFIFMFFFLFFLVSYDPNFLGDSENYNYANQMVTPFSIKPEWYFLFAYAILRGVPNKLGGVIALISSIMVLILIPFLDTSNFKGLFFYPFLKFYYLFFIFVFIVLTVLGSKGTDWPFNFFSLLFSFMYFLYFLILDWFKLLMDNYMSKEDICFIM